MVTTTVKLDSPIFKTDTFRQAMSAIPFKSAKIFQSLTVQRMVNSVPAGRITQYKGKLFGVSQRGTGFKRGFRRSARGQRPAVETGTLINAVDSRRLAEFSAETFIRHARNPRNLHDAQKYAEELQSEMNRLIMVGQDVRLAQVEQNTRVTDTVKKFV